MLIRWCVGQCEPRGRRRAIGRRPGAAVRPVLPALRARRARPSPHARLPLADHARRQHLAEGEQV